MWDRVDVMFVCKNPVWHVGFITDFPVIHPSKQRVNYAYVLTTLSARIETKSLKKVQRTEKLMYSAGNVHIASHYRIERNIPHQFSNDNKTNNSWTQLPTKHTDQRFTNFADRPNTAMDDKHKRKARGNSRTLIHSPKYLDLPLPDLSNKLLNLKRRCGEVRRSVNTGWKTDEWNADMESGSH